MEDLRLQVRDDDALQKFEKAALYYLDPIKLGVLLLELAQYERDHHLVGLLVQLTQLYRADLVVPALHARRVMDFEN